MLDDCQIWEDVGSQHLALDDGQVNLNDVDRQRGSQYARLKGRRGDGKAVVAVVHSMLVIAYHVLSRQEPYHDLGNRLIRQLERLGYEVMLTPAA